MARHIPLACKLRPSKLEHVIGQDHLIGEGMPLYRMAQCGKFQSTILWGSPGIGKTSIVRALASQTESNFCVLNATSASVKDLRAIIKQATQLLEQDEPIKTVLFVDEIHRFNKSQQDVMLPVVEDGTVVLFGATTENPKFAVNSTILSRCLVLEVKPLDAQSMIELIKRIKNHYKNSGQTIDVKKEAAKKLIYRCSGDARKMITSLETIIDILSTDGVVSEEHVDVAIPDKHLVFDAHGNDHYDLAHCYQEAIQNSDADAAIYWLAKWLESGEDPAYICRRMLITAFEDCASNPMAACLAMAASYTTERTGMPECDIAMSLATVVMAQSERNKTAYFAIREALDDVRNGATIHVPESLRAGTKGYFAAISKKYVT
ncbi:AAA family ATPase [bacterium]|nr:AAA family ATPase [bacterium]